MAEPYKDQTTISAAGLAELFDMTPHELKVTANGRSHWIIRRTCDGEWRPFYMNGGRLAGYRFHKDEE